METTKTSLKTLSHPIQEGTLPRFRLGRSLTSNWVERLSERLGQRERRLQLGSLSAVVRRVGYTTNWLELLLTIGMFFALFLGLYAGLVEVWRF